MLYGRESLEIMLMTCRDSTPRFVSLLYFAQSLFLVFAAVYIAKESIEQVILGSGAHEHALGGSHGHGEAVIDGDERLVPFCQGVSKAANS